MIDWQRLGEPVIGDHCAGEPFGEQHREPLKSACAEDQEIWEIYSSNFGPDGFDEAIDALSAAPNNKVFVLFDGDELAGFDDQVGLLEHIARAVAFVHAAHFQAHALGL